MNVTGTEICPVQAVPSLAGIERYVSRTSFTGEDRPAPARSSSDGGAPGFPVAFFSDWECPAVSISLLTSWL